MPDNPLPKNAAEFMKSQANPGRFQVFEHDAGAYGEPSCDRFGESRSVQVRVLDSNGGVVGDTLLSVNEARELFNELGRFLNMLNDGD